MAQKKVPASQYSGHLSIGAEEGVSKRQDPTLLHVLQNLRPLESRRAEASSGIVSPGGPMDDQKSTPEYTMVEIKAVRGKVTYHDRAPYRKFNDPRRKGKLSRSGGNGVTLPPEITNVAMYVHTFRFYSVTNNTRLITIADLFGICGGICYVTNNSLRCFVCSYRIRRISCYPSNGASVRIGWYHSAGQGKDVEYDRTVPANISVSTPLHTSPPKESLAGFWTDASATLSTVMFEVYQTSTGSVWDVEMECINNGVDAGPALGIATGVLGSTYYLPLDASSGGGINCLNRPTTV